MPQWALVGPGAARESLGTSILSTLGFATLIYTNGFDLYIVNRFDGWSMGGSSYNVHVPPPLHTAANGFIRSFGYW